MKYENYQKAKDLYGKIVDCERIVGELEEPGVCIGMRKNSHNVVLVETDITSKTPLASLAYSFKMTLIDHYKGVAEKLKKEMEEL
jgi:hypothetical protein